MKKYLIFLSLICFPFIISCTQDITAGVNFDEKQFNSQKSKWESFETSSYSFNYDFFYNSLPLPYVTGKVKVENGKSTVEIKCETNPDEDLSENSKYYLKDINSVFDSVYNAYKNSLEVSKNNKSYISYKIEYDSSYGFPAYVTNSEIKPKCKEKESQLDQPGQSSGDFGLQITDFSIDINK